MKIALIPMTSSGRINICLTLAHKLAKFNHECVLILPSNWAQMVKSAGFNAETFDQEEENQGDVRKSSSSFVTQQAAIFKLPAVQQFPLVGAFGFKSCADTVEKNNEQYAEAIKRVQPDLIIFDYWTTVPAIVHSGVPYVLLFSCSPLMVYWQYNAPPFSSGLAKGDDVKLINETREIFSKAIEPVRNKFDEYLKSKGIVIENRLDFSLVGQSPYLNIYPYPSDLDYQEFGPVPDKWFRLDHMVREVDDSPLGIPDESWLNPSSNGDQKLILFSLGSMVTAYVDLMKRLISILASSPHRFIVSKGVNHESIDLPSNMVGGKYLNQMKIIPKVDLVIHHGGNSTFVETLYFGKPCIILPVCGDQFDNGRRVVDMEIGASFNPFEVTEEELLKAIDNIVNCPKINEKVQKIGHNLRNTPSFVQLNEKLEQIVANQK
ncbi:uncharacterized UDP-glucosyltransferase YjiC-like [Tetranychus urticae]|uniref:UDP-glycosyltransferase 203G1 n=1 Tax=Tetranychus urticae TaxID=32264 RepID=T1L3T6_TETUR|nr:uncharacterized UDP-glucosyltransferase YjiC-like [Tetranychus urticae]AHX56901.1 UDP-glycosyltransferase 203G1 [Tetranychus urticae]